MDGEVMLALAFSLAAGLSTVIGAAIVFMIREIKQRQIAFFMGLSAGVMVYISFVELIPVAIEEVDFFSANVAFFFGVAFVAVADFLVPHEYEVETLPNGCRGEKNCLMRTSKFIFIGIAIHNLPEGLATFFGTLKDTGLGMTLMLATMMHNIPEGIAVAFPIFSATGDRKKAFNLAFISGMAEPVGAVLGFLVLAPFLNEGLLSLVMAFVAGVMVFISFDEILPICLRPGEEHAPIAGVFTGMLIMAATLFVLG